MDQQWDQDHDCWWLVRDVYKNEFDIDLPLSGIDPTSLIAIARGLRETEIKRLFVEIDRPEEWAVAEYLTLTQRSFHVGVCIQTDDGLRVLNLSATRGLICEPPTQQFRWWRYVG